MRRVMRGWLILAAVLAATWSALMAPGCAPPPAGGPGVRTPARASIQHRPATQPSAPPETYTVGISIDGREVLVLQGGVAETPEGPAAYRFGGDKPAGPAPDGRVACLLKPDREDLPVVACSITDQLEGRQVSVLLSADQGLPALRLLAATTGRWLPVRMSPATREGYVQSAIGPIGGGQVDGLFHAGEDHALRVEGDVTYQAASAGEVWLTAAAHPGSRTQSVLTITSYKDFLRTAHRLEEYAPVNDLPSSGAAGWAYRVRWGINETEVMANATWLAVNLNPFGAEFVWFGTPAGLDVQSLDGRTRVELESCRGRLDRLGLKTDLYRVEAEPGVSPTSLKRGDAAQAFKQLTAAVRSIMENCWALGVVQPGETFPGQRVPLQVGAPLTLEQARMWTSVVGLSGRPLMMGDRLDSLPHERVEMLRRLCPPAPIRTVDLFRHDLPVVWNLRIVTDFDQWNILGVFNWSPEPAMETLDLDELGSGSDTGSPWVVYDVWEKRLVAVTRDRFDVHLPGESCRVLRLSRVRTNQPTPLGSSRHLTQGAVDLADVRFHAEGLTLSGRSNVVAAEPYELPVFVPEGENSFDVERVEVTGAVARVRADGPIRMVTLESDRTGWIEWSILFRKAPAAPRAPAAPVQLRAEQNTRGLRLSWLPGDQRAVAYRVYRDGTHVGDTAGGQCAYQDCHVLYDRRYTYAVSAVDGSGHESARSGEITHQTPIPASTNLTQLLPLAVTQDHPAFGRDTSLLGDPLRIAGRRHYRGIGTRANARIRYFLGGGYDRFTGGVGIDDETEGQGSAVFRIAADGQTLFTSEVMRGGQPPQPFSVDISGRMHLELIVTDAGDGTDDDHADWVDPYLHVDPGQRRRAVPAMTGPPPLPAPATHPAAPTRHVDRVLIDTTLGRIVVELDPERTPATVESFLQYVDERFYDGTIIHRVEAGYVIQGGGYTADLTEKPTRPPIRNESRRAAGNLRGTVAMGHRTDPDSATSQFYFNLRDNPHLDTYGGGYCVFGRVVDGMDVLDRLAEVPTERRSETFPSLPRDTILIRSIRRK